MGRLFGTDGIRGVANVDLRPPLAYALGRAVAHRLAPGGGAIVVGQDTRRSCDMLVAAIVAGATSMGANVHRLGVVPTPALAHVAASGEFRAAVMVSASHNPADDNGLKVLDEHGLKLDDQVEDELERLILGADELPSPTNADLGREIPAPRLIDGYVAQRGGLAERIGGHLHIVLDCANGSAGTVAPAILSRTGGRVDTIFNEPDGKNINLACGATAPQALAREVVSRGADIGFALDGDGDRLIAVDHDGGIVDGDRVLGILALDRLARGALPGGLLIVSILSNGGLVSAVEQAGGTVVRTPVGDKYILEGMLVEGAGLGGEKSGHVIVREHSTSGDGVLTALQILDVMARTGRSLSELAAAIPLFPQEQRAVAVRHRDQWESDPTLRSAMIEAERRLAGRGRVVVRPSGTEPALRVMVEGEDGDLVAELADSLAAVAVERLD
ncbi:MAG TPA: phosphoglucosamine mutase [Candidatus Limnocylindrales bacterium]|nr:phosphoglucosamine mutase [Candidatus Limnocylindrales bacterium]